MIIEQSQHIIDEISKVFIGKDEIIKKVLMTIYAGGHILLNVLIAESFGGGDIKLMFVSGIALGWKYSLLAAFIGILLAGSYSIYLLVSKKINKKGHIAFGPYLSIGIFIALSYGSEIISWYLNLMM